MNANAAVEHVAAHLDDHGNPNDPVDAEAVAVLRAAMANTPERAARLRWASWRHLRTEGASQ